MNPRLCFFLVLLVGCQSLPISSDDDSTQTIQVSYVDLEGQAHLLTLPLYSTLSNILEQIDCDACDLSRLNPQTPLQDKDILVLYPKADSCISLNQATSTELESLPYIGPQLAQRIVEDRLAHGLYQKLEDIMRVKGIKEALFSKILTSICL